MDSFDCFIDEIIGDDKVLDNLMDFAKCYVINPNFAYRRSVHWNGWLRKYEQLCAPHNRSRYLEPNNVAEVFEKMMKLRKYFEALCGGEMFCKGVFLFGLNEVYKCPMGFQFPTGKYQHLQLYVSLFVKQGLL